MAELFVCLAEETLDSNEQSDLFESMFNNFVSSLSKYDIITTETMHENLILIEDTINSLKSI
nr:MAG TPA: hypothetical protein [Caudoviricetes sp.]